MRVKCVVCDSINHLDDESPVAKKLRNRPIHTYMCDICHGRIATNTEARLATGKFKFFRTSSKTDEDF